MGKTAFATDNPLTKKAWEERLFRDTVKEAYFNRFMGTTSASLCQVQEQLTKQKGDQITFGIRMRLQGAGVTSGQKLEENEEKLVTHSFNILLEEYAHAVRDEGPLDRQRAMFSIDEESVQALKDWGSEKLDQLLMDALVYSPTKIFYGGDATSTGTIEAGDKITPALISKVKTWCLTGGGRSQTPLRPVKVNGKNYFILLVHPDVIYDLSQDTNWSQAAREALPRGTDNPLFNGAEYLWDNVLIHSHENVPIVTNWGSGTNIPGAKCIFMGAQSLVWAWGKRPKVVPAEFDYGREHGYGWMFLGRAGKPNFNSTDYGSVGFYVSRTNIAGA